MLGLSLDVTRKRSQHFQCGPCACSCRTSESAGVSAPQCACHEAVGQARPSSVVCKPTYADETLNSLPASVHTTKTGNPQPQASCPLSQYLPAKLSVMKLHQIRSPSLLPQASRNMTCAWQASVKHGDSISDQTEQNSDHKQLNHEETGNPGNISIGCKAAQGKQKEHLEVSHRFRIGTGVAHRTDHSAVQKSGSRRTSCLQVPAAGLKSPRKIT